jgi:NitT/TauT family transport system ATP-binding protein
MQKSKTEDPLGDYSAMFTQKGSASQTSRILELRNLRKTHVRENGKNDREDLVVLDDISFDVDEGEFVTVIGPSGCGKSTLLNIVAGLESYQGGDIVVSGHRVSSVGPDIVMIFQEEALFPWLTVLENVSFGLRHKKNLTKEDRGKIAMQYVEMVQLGQFAHSYIHQLSGGMKQRVAIARGLAMNPRILLMDEPFGALDYRTREILQQQIQEIHEKTKKTILFVTHDVREAVSLGDRVILLSHRPTKIKQQYVVDLPRPRSAEDPHLHGLINTIQKELREEIKYAAAATGTEEDIELGI